MDLHACLPEGEILMIPPGDIAKVPIGISIAVPTGFEAQVRARSGLASKHGITPVNGVGTIDSDYRGEVIVPLINLGRAGLEELLATEGEAVVNCQFCGNTYLFAADDLEMILAGMP